MAAISLPAQIVRTRRFTLGVPGQFTVAPDGASVLFLRSPAGHDPLTCLWSLDLASGTERLLATGIASYATDATATLAAFTLGGALWTVSVATGQARRLPARSPVTDPRPDPAGRRIAYLSGGALRVIEADGAADCALMAPDDPDDPDDPDVTFGTEDLTAATSLTGPRGYWWAPDGARLLVTRVGIRGWSFGGSLAALAVLRRPDVFPASTLRLSSALLAAGRPHEVLLLVGVGHHPIGTPVTEHLLQHQVRFLQRHLGAVPGDL